MKHEEELYVNIQPLFQIQKKLDAHIAAKHQLEDKALLPYKLMALRVELAELANETRAFKYWSLKGPSPQNVLLEEYVDCLHFILSIGMEKGGNNIPFKTGLNHLSDTQRLAGGDRDSGAVHSAADRQSAVFDKLESTFKAVEDLAREQTEQHYAHLCTQFLELGKVLGFSWTHIEDAYLSKNEVNYARQEQGY
jgi:dimeric dUTPase (all-alpha-NTP-PPase superfamily)